MASLYGREAMNDIGPAKRRSVNPSRSTRFLGRWRLLRTNRQRARRAQPRQICARAHLAAFISSSPTYQAFDARQQERRVVRDSVREDDLDVINVANVLIRSTADDLQVGLFAHGDAAGAILYP